MVVSSAVVAVHVPVTVVIVLLVAVVVLVQCRPEERTCQSY